MKVPFMIGQQVYLRGLERADLAAMVEWINDHDVTRLLFMGDRPANIELLEEQWEHSQRSQNEIVFAVCDKKDDAFIGAQLDRGPCRFPNRRLEHEPAGVVVVTSH